MFAPSSCTRPVTLNWHVSVSPTAFSPLLMPSNMMLSPLIMRFSETEARPAMPRTSEPSTNNAAFIRVHRSDASTAKRLVCLA